MRCNLPITEPQRTEYFFSISGRFLFTKALEILTLETVKGFSLKTVFVVLRFLNTGLIVIIIFDVSKYKTVPFRI